MTSPIRSALSTDKPRFVGEWVRVSDAFDLRMGKTPSRKNPLYWRDGENDWISIADLGSFDKFVGDTKERISEIAVAESGIKPVPADTVLMSFKLSIGKTSITTKPVYTNEAIIAFVDKGIYPVHPDFMYHQCMAKNWSTAANTAVMGKTLNKKTLGQAMVYLPDIAKQREIAGKLDYIDGQIARIKKTSSKLDSLVKSRFIEMFGELRENRQVELQNVCSLITDGTHQPPMFAREGIPFLFVRNIAGNEITYETEKFVDKPSYEQLIKRTPIEIGDLLISAVGSFGHPAVIRSDRPFCFQRHIAYLKPKRDMIDSVYLHSYLLAEDAQAYMDKVATGVAQRTVSLKSLKAMPVPLPALTEQQSFASFVSQVDKLRFAGNHEMNFRCECFTLS